MMPLQKPQFKKLRLKYLSATLIVFTVFFALLQLVLYLYKEGIIPIPDFLNKHLWSLSFIIGTFLFITLLLRLTIKRVYNLFDAPEEKIFYSKIFSWALYSIGVFVVLNQLGVSLGNITLFVGLLATGFAFAIRDVLISFFGWMILLRKKPFRIGDYIRIGEDEGKVMHIGTFYVLLDNSPDSEEVYNRVPNRLFLEKSIKNLGKTHYHEKIKLQITAIPDRSLLEKTQNTIVQQLSATSEVSLSINIEGEKPILLLEYLVTFEKKGLMKKEALFVLSNRLKALLFFPK